MDQVDDNALIQAMRQRLLEEIRAKREAANVINNNVYGGGTPAAGIGAEAGGMSDPDGSDYMVDIIRENIDPADPKKGWKKQVHRYKQPKKKVTDEK